MENFTEEEIPTEYGLGGVDGPGWLGVVWNGGTLAGSGRWGQAREISWAKMLCVDIFLIFR